MDSMSIKEQSDFLKALSNSMTDVKGTGQQVSIQKIKSEQNLLETIPTGKSPIKWYAQQFILRGFICHLSTETAKGHYIFYGYEEKSDQWWMHDDETVTKVWFCVTPLC